MTAVAQYPNNSGLMYRISRAPADVSHQVVIHGEKPITPKPQDAAAKLATAIVKVRKPRKKNAFNQQHVGRAANQYCTFCGGRIAYGGGTIHPACQETKDRIAKSK